jgi:tRNA uridine 5-carboxymethylaminomethyl modification enzyme
MKYCEEYDVAVIGTGHAGIEAALISAKMGMKTILFGLNIDTIGMMPCNPSIGGPGKSQLVAEIDALGGIMALAADQNMLSVRLLNTSKGPAVWSLRAQIDRKRYSVYMKEMAEKVSNLHLSMSVVDEIVVEDKKVIGVVNTFGKFFKTKAAIVAAGTFLNGKIFVGKRVIEAGRLGELPTKRLSDSLAKLGHTRKRLKTGTPPRLIKSTLDLDEMDVQYTDEVPRAFSFRSKKRALTKDYPVYITRTNEKTHNIIEKNLHLAPVYSGLIMSQGPRYCPSIETKVAMFPERKSHQLFIEPEGKDVNEVYVQGMFTGLPYEVQLDMIHSVPGLRNAVMSRPGYNIEYDYFDPSLIYPTMESKIVSGLYMAGQVNGTSGYEEAAAQGLMAGINAALKIKNDEEFILQRSEAYIGVLADDITTKELLDPYRMLTSRVEYRLLLREDNAIYRLFEKAYKLGTIDKVEYEKIKSKKDLMDRLIKNADEVKIPMKLANKILSKYGSKTNQGMNLKQILKRPEVKYKDIIEFLPEEYKEVDEDIVKQVEIEIKYKGYIDKALFEINKFEEYEKIKIPPGFGYDHIDTISKESREKLSKYRPISIGQASRISGVKPSDIMTLVMYLKNKER